MKAYWVAGGSRSRPTESQEVKGLAYRVSWGLGVGLQGPKWLMGRPPGLKGSRGRPTGSEGPRVRPAGAIELV